MLYRMKQNAVGLANICILASAVLVTISSCVCLYIGEEDMLDSLYPREVAVTVYRNKYAEKPEPDLLAATQEIAQSYDMELLDPHHSNQMRCLCASERQCHHQHP